MATQEKQQKEHLANFNIAGFTYYDGAEAFSKLSMGQKLSLELEKDNPYDARAIVIKHDTYKLGYIPREHNRIFYKLLNLGINQIEVRIQRIDERANPENQIGVVAHLVGINAD